MTTKFNENLDLILSLKFDFKKHLKMVGFGGVMGTIFGVKNGPKQYSNFTSKMNGKWVPFGGSLGSPEGPKMGLFFGFNFILAPRGPRRPHKGPKRGPQGRQKGSKRAPEGSQEGFKT